LFTQANAAEVEKTKAQLSATLKFLHANWVNRPLHHGDVLQAFRIEDIFKVLVDNPRGMPVSTGPGLALRLAGKTFEDGREGLFVTLDGSEVFSESDGSLTVTMSGYGIIDTRTGVYQSSAMLTEAVIANKGQTIRFQERQIGKIHF
jgi:hypothetical protein